MSGLAKEERIVVEVAADEFARDCELEITYAEENCFLKLSTVSVNRPGLMLTGYTKFFASSRVQVFGKSEMTYLASLEPAVRRERLDGLFAQGMPAIVITRGQRATKDILELAREHKIPVFGSDAITASVVNKIVIYLNAKLAPRESRHAVMLEIFGTGVLVLGDSGIGKSEMALELIGRGHRLISDDLVELKRIGDNVYGEAPELIKHLMEIRGVGIIDIKAMFGVGAVKNTKRVELVVELERWDDSKEYDRVGNERYSEPILGVEIPKNIIPVSTGRNLAVIIEVAVRDFRLKQDGYSTLEELDKRRGK